MRIDRLQQLTEKSLIFFSIVLLFSCGTSKKAGNDILYFQKGLDSMGTVLLKDPIIQPDDLLSIQVFSKTLSQEQASLFNIANTIQGSGGYLVDLTRGTIEMPIIGEIRAAGLTRAQLRTSLIEKLSPYVKDPSVLVRFVQFRINVLGEVNQPGTKNFQTDRVTIIDALSAAGDLKDDGKRDNILIIREVDRKREYYFIDLKNAAFLNSPAYQLQQNDVVYVGANSKKMKQLNQNPNAQKNLQLGLSVISVITSVVGILAFLIK